MKLTFVRFILAMGCSIAGEILRDTESVVASEMIRWAGRGGRVLCRRALCLVLNATPVRAFDMTLPIPGFAT